MLFVWVTQSRIDAAAFVLANVNLEALIFQASGRKLGRVWVFLIHDASA